MTDAQGEEIRPLLPKPPEDRHGGHPRASDRKVLEDPLWILRGAAHWQDLPDEFPHPSTCSRRLRDWEKKGIRLKIWRRFPGQLNERQQLQ